MRGKKIDTNFVADYISTCAMQGKISPEKIVDQATMDIKAIDNKIKEVEELKKLRSKLVDVLISLNEKKIDNSVEMTILNFYKVKNLPLALYLCSLVEKSPKNINEFKTAFPIEKDAFSTAKDLLEISVLKRNDKNIEKGKFFSDFVSYVNKRYNKT